MALLGRLIKHLYHRIADEANGGGASLCDGTTRISLALSLGSAGVWPLDRRVDAEPSRDKRLRLLFGYVTANRYPNLAELKSGPLLRAGEAAGFEVLITVDGWTIAELVMWVERMLTSTQKGWLGLGSCFLLWQFASFILVRPSASFGSGILASIYVTSRRFYRGTTADNTGLPSCFLCGYGCH